MQITRKISIVYSISLIAFTVWSILIVVESLSDISSEKQKTTELARKEALTVFNKDRAFRFWATEHGGVYVPISEKTPPNPYLSHIPNREIISPSGEKLTLMNPAYILRQVMNDYANVYGIKGHLTSLNVLNPQNAPDDWERHALAKFELGVNEVFNIDNSGTEPYLRLIRPLIAKEGCLKCHAHQGYKPGDVRGGVSVGIPLKPYQSAERKLIKNIILTHFLFWIVGSIFLLIFPFWGKSRLRELNRTQDELLKSELEFRSIIQSSPVPMVIVDKQGDILSYNSKFTKLFGYTIDDISTAETWWSTVYPDPEYREKIRTSWEMVVAQSQTTGKELETQTCDMTGKNGQTYTVEFNLVPLKRVSVIALNDITQRKKTEEFLVKSEERYKEAQRIAHIGHWEFDLVQDNLFWSEEVYRIFEIDPDKFDASYELFVEHIHPEDKETVNKAYSDSLTNETTYNISHRLLFTDGRIKYVHGRFQTEYDNTEKPVRSIGTIQDITKKKLAEEEHDRLVTAIEQTAESIIITDQRGDIQYVNPSFEQITGYSRKEVLGKNPRFLNSGQHDAAFYQEIWATLSNGKVWKGRLINNKKNGTLFEEEATISPVFNKSGHIINYVAVKRDVTKEIEIAQQLQQSQKMEAIGTLAGGIAHDFNNILSAILGYTDMVLEDLPEDSPAADDLQKVMKAGNRATALVQQILTFSRQSDQELQPLRIQLVLMEAAKLLRSSIPATIEIKQNIDPNCRPVLADPTQIHQIIMNLCTNAYQAMRETGGKLLVSLEDVELTQEDLNNKINLQPASYVKLAISDTGCGIPKNILDKIFEPYFTTKAKGEGTGMGLATVHGIVLSFDGDITVYSEPGEGTVFNIYLPIIQETTVAIEEEDTAAIPTGNEQIILVDDDEELVLMNKTMLESLGYKITALTSSVTALNTFKKEPDGFDLVLTDMTMPVLTGAELSVEILAIRPDIPIIICTGFSELINKEKAQDIGIRGFVMKPVIKKDLAKAIRKVLDTTNLSI